jgi:hypothetical protein
MRVLLVFLSHEIGGAIYKLIFIIVAKHDGHWLPLFERRQIGLQLTDTPGVTLWVWISRSNTVEGIHRDRAAATRSIR